MKTIFSFLAILCLATYARSADITTITPLGAAPDPTNDLMYIWDQSVGAGGANGGMKSMTPANLFTSPALTTPNIGTPSAGTLTSCTGLPIATGVSGLGTGVATFLATPSGANLASALTTALPASKGGTGLTALSANVVTLLGAADFAAFRSSLGLDTGDSPQFTGIELSHASANTLTASSGVLSIEGAALAFQSTTMTVAGTANEIASSAGAQSLGANRTWTLSLPSALTFTGKTITGGTFNSPTIDAPTVSGTATFSGTINATSGTVGALGFSRTLSSDDTCSGIRLVDVNAGATIAQWEAVYYSFSDGEWMLADANGTGTYPAQALAVAAGTNGGALEVITQGFVRNDAWNWSAGFIYLSATEGGLTQTAPSTSGDKVQIVGFAITADVAYFHFNPTFVEVE